MANRVDAKGQASEFDYTDAGYVDAMRVRAAGGALERVADYTTDPDGNATEIAEQVGGVSAVRNRTFDARGRMRSETDGAGNRVAWTLDTAGNVTRLDVEAGASAWAVGYGYDGQNRVTTVTDQTAGSRLLASYVWRGDDQMASVTYGNGAVRQYGYDTGNRLTSVENTWTGGSERFDYGYDVGSNRKTEERRVDGQLVRSVAYRHDVEDRLTEAAYTTPAAGGNPEVTRAMTWGYDLVGNRTREVGTDPATGAAVDRTTVYNDRNEPVTMADAADAAKNATFAHDANGNLTTVLRGGIETRYAYDGRDQMVRASRVEGGVETVVGEYGYDAERRRTQSVAGGVTKRSVWAGQSVAAEVAGGTAVSRYDSGTDLIRTELAGEGERWYGRDAMGTTTSLTSSPGAVTARAEYDAWGERIAETGATANRVGFTGYREDAETGLDYAINRYYSPETGRFTTHDPLTELDRPERLNQPQGLNLYPYVMGAPTRYTDADGRDWWVEGDSGTVYYKLHWVIDGAYAKMQSEGILAATPRLHWPTVDEAKKANWRPVVAGESFGKLIYGWEGTNFEDYYGHPLLVIDPTDFRFRMAFWKKDVFEASCQTEEPSPTTGANDGAAEPEPRYYWRQTPIADDEPTVKFTREFSRSAIRAQFGDISVMTRGYLGGEQIYDLDGHYLGYKPGASGRVESDGLGPLEYFIPCRISWVAIRAALAGLARRTIGRAVKNGVRVGVVRKVPITDPSRLIAPVRTVRHHLFNKFRGKSPRSETYRAFFRKHKINVDDFVVEIPEAMHKKWIHRLGEKWTTRWKDWIDANPEATTREVYQFAGQLMDEYGLVGEDIIKYHAR